MITKKSFIDLLSQFIEFQNGQSKALTIRLILPSKAYYVLMQLFAHWPEFRPPIWDYGENNQYEATWMYNGHTIHIDEGKTYRLETIPGTQPTENVVKMFPVLDGGLDYPRINKLQIAV